MLVDSFGRHITYIRISLTDRCNLRCRYCMPREGPEWLERDDLLSYDEIEKFVRAAASEGITKIRLTGGEPLVRPGVPNLVSRLTQVPGITKVALTTNGTLLEQHAEALHGAGLRSLNISLDSLRPERFKDITRFDLYHRVLAGLNRALDTGFQQLKLNVVVIRGFNDDEIEAFAAMSKELPLHVRFIEYMPIGGDTVHWSRDKVVPIAEIVDQLHLMGNFEPEIEAAADAGPARVFRYAGAPGTVGFITPVSDEFCARCNRVRLTSDGMLRGCLMQDGELNFREALRSGATEDDLRQMLHLAMARKPEKHLINAPEFAHSSYYTMNRLGG